MKEIVHMMHLANRLSPSPILRRCYVHFILIRTDFDRNGPKISSAIGIFRKGEIYAAVNKNSDGDEITSVVNS
jgi:hypothetical protein